MPAIHETAYPRLKASLTTKELADAFTPTSREMRLAGNLAKGWSARLCFLTLLKTFQRLGYFTPLRDVPKIIIDHIALYSGKTKRQPDLAAYDESGTRRRHISVIRRYLGVKSFNKRGQSVLAAACKEGARTKEDLVDIINVGMEELVRQRFELPGFTTMFEESQRVRAEVNRSLYKAVSGALGDEGRALIERLLTASAETKRSPWNALKADPGSATLSHLRDLVGHLQWLSSQNVGVGILTRLPDVKVRRFAAEAKSLDAARMREVEPCKRHTLATALVKEQVALCLDDLGEMLVKRMSRIHRKGQEALDEHRAKHQSETDKLVSILHDLLTFMRKDGTSEERLAEMRGLLKGQREKVIESCEAYLAHADNNYTPFLWRYFKSHRRTLCSLLDHINLTSTSQDLSLEKAIAFLKRHHSAKSEWLLIEKSGELPFSWIPDKWWKLVTGLSSRRVAPERVDRRQFEVCLFTQVTMELKSGDLCIEGSGKFADYRRQLISWEVYDKSVAAYGRQLGLRVDGDGFVEQVRGLLEKTAAATDDAFPGNDSIRIEDGEPVLTRLERKPIPDQLKTLEQLLSNRTTPTGILDAIADTENWLGWSRAFGPLSGYDTKLNNPKERYVATAFCYGCNLGPAQTARSLKGVDRKQIAWINQRHVSEERLDEAIVTVINAYNRFTLPKLWGSGKSVSADGTKWNLYEQNILSEYHIRYGGYGGIGYYHVSDTYIALFSHFISCGIWEAVHILDGLLNNKSDIKPDRLHADTQGQSTPVFALAYLLGIMLMPRIRNWKDLKLFRPSKNTRYTHIDALFSEAIDWKLIKTHLPDMLRIALSIRAGLITPSTLLRKLGTYSRKNKLYNAMCELGRVVRTVFLLQYIGDGNMRQTIQAATNKSESFNAFTKWVAFGGEAIGENNREEQRKFIKYNHLVSNCLIFHNVHTMTRLLHQSAVEGCVFDDETISQLSPYLTEHINRFGNYSLDMGKKMPKPNYGLKINQPVKIPSHKT